MSEQPPAEAPRGWPWLMLIVAGGLSLRLYAAVVAYCSTFDTATVGLMGLHILDGERPLFFYGQEYMGSIEAYVAAIMFALFGPSELALSLAPMIFSLLWIVSAYLLFRDLLGRPAGLAAALCVAFPGWEILWYCVGSYGGYPEAFTLATLSLWLVVRIAGRPMPAFQHWLHVLALGLLSGLAMWTHSISAAWLFTGVLILAGAWFSRRFDPAFLAPFPVGAALLLLGILPVILTLDSSSASDFARLDWSGSAIHRHFVQLFERPLKNHLFSPRTMPVQSRAAVLALCALALMLYAWRIVRAQDGRERLRLLMPILFASVFLSFYLPHSMAETKAPRYTIPLWSMTLCGVSAAIVGLKNRLLRTTAWALLASMLVFYAACDIRTIERKRSVKAELMADRAKVVELAGQAGLKNTLLMGGEIFGHEGQILTFTAKGRIRFVSAYDERYQPNQLAADADSRKGLLCESASRKALCAALNAMAVTYRVTEAPARCLISDIVPSALARRSIMPAELRVLPGNTNSGIPSAILDRTSRTTLGGTYGTNTAFTVDLGRTRRVNGFWLVGADASQSGLPQCLAYCVSDSADRPPDAASNNVRRIAVSWLNGDSPYFKGHYGMQETRFEPVEGRFLHLTFTGGQRNHDSWEIDEVYVFEDSGRPPTAQLPQEADAVADCMRQRHITFVAADRWLSANLNGRLPQTDGKPSVFLTYNHKHRNTRISRELSPDSHTAFVVASEVADDCRQILADTCGSSTTWTMIVFGRYVAFLPPADMPTHPVPRLFWNGHALLKSPPPH